MRKRINHYIPTTYMKLVALSVCVIMAYGTVATFVR